MTIDTDNLIAHAVKMIPPLELGVVMLAAAMGHGTGRRLNAILKLARTNRANETVVCAAFGFLPRYLPDRGRLDGLWVDVFTPTYDPHAPIIGDLDDSPAVAAAFALARAAHGEANYCTVRFTDPAAFERRAAEQRAEWRTLTPGIARRFNERNAEPCASTC